MKRMISKVTVLLLLFSITFMVCSCKNGVVDAEKAIKEIGVVTEDSFELIQSARQLYDNLSEEEKLQVKNYDILVSAEDAFKPLAVEKCKAIFDSGAYSDGQDFYRNCAEFFTDKEKLECLTRYAGNYACDYIEDRLISSLKNPASYICYGRQYSVLEVNQTYGSHCVSVTITYSATNSFGGRLQNDYQDYVYFNPNLENGTLEDVQTLHEAVMNNLDLLP